MVLIYLILCALYESVFIPFAVLLSVPCGLMGSFLFAWLFGLENNIYMQTGLIMIIGLLAKTAILLTEYAGKRRSEGMTLAQAAYSAAKVRLRPILMTVLSMVFGLIPLMMAHGVGANGSRSLARHRRNWWHDSGHIGIAVPRAIAVHRISIYSRTSET